VDNALYHRRQAELCLQIAELMSDPAAAKFLREDATRHFAEATELGNGTSPVKERNVIRRSPRQV
jgi:hypothetical protein